jgi:hypothetical protein
LKVRTYIQLALLSGAICFVSASCNNYGLLDKLANPGSGGGGYYAFVTSITTDGQLGFQLAGSSQVPSCTGTGIANADCVCQALADKQSYLAGKVYKAWLSTSTEDMTCRIQGMTGNNCANSGGPTWSNATNEVLASGYADLFDSMLTGQLKYDEVKNGQGGNAWTGTDGNGLRAITGSPTANCNDWTQSTGGTASYGDLGLNASGWSNNGSLSQACSTAMRIYCFAIK